MSVRVKTDLINHALVRIGGQRITSDLDDSEFNNIAQLVYDDMLELVLCEHAWGFAQKRVALAQKVETIVDLDEGMDYVYERPADLVCINLFYPRNAKYRLEADGILCDNSTLRIKYTFKLENVSAYPAYFKNAFVVRLAAEIGFNFTPSLKKAAALIEEYEKLKLPRAIYLDKKQMMKQTLEPWGYEQERRQSSEEIQPPVGSQGGDSTVAWE